MTMLFKICYVSNIRLRNVKCYKSAIRTRVLSYIKVVKICNV